MSQITILTSMNQLDSFLKTDKLVIIDFHAVWCGPCKTIAPKFIELSNEFKGCRFAKCDVDQSQEIAKKYSVAAMPTFLFIKKGVVVETIKGANPSALTAAIKKHGGATSSTGGSEFPGSGHSLSGKSTPATSSGSGGKPWYLENAKVLLFGLVVVGLFFYSKE